MQPCPNLRAYSIQFNQARDRAAEKQEYVAVLHVDVASISQIAPLSKNAQKATAIFWQSTI